MGLEYDRDASRWRWYDSWQDDYSRADAAYLNGIPVDRYGTSDAGVIRVSGASYDIGIYKHPSKPGVFVPVYDNWNNGMGLETACGPGLGKLKQQYATQVTKRQLSRQGFRVVQQQVPGGKVRLVAVR